MFKVLFGIPEIEEQWNALLEKKEKGSITKDELSLLNKWAKVISYLSSNPKHPSLQTHEITVLSVKFGHRVWQSYLENKTPKPYRLYWVYGPKQKQITLIGLERHPEGSNQAYISISLSDFPTEDEN